MNIAAYYRLHMSNYSFDIGTRSRGHKLFMKEFTLLVKRIFLTIQEVKCQISL